MSNDSPARILYDEDGNPVGVLQDDAVYRLQVEAKLATGNALAGRVKAIPYDSVGNETTLELLTTMELVLAELKKITLHLSSMTDEELLPGDEEV